MPKLAMRALRVALPLTGGQVHHVAGPAKPTGASRWPGMPIMKRFSKSTGTGSGCFVQALRMCSITPLIRSGLVICSS